MQPVLWIHLILILDPGSALEKKWIWSGSRSLTFLLSFNDFFKEEFLKNLLFWLIFMLKLDERWRDESIFNNSLFPAVQIWVLRVKEFFVAILLLKILSLDPDPCNRIFLRIRIQEAKILRILILSISTACNLFTFSRSYYLRPHVQGSQGLDWVDRKGSIRYTCCICSWVVYWGNRLLFL